MTDLVYEIEKCDEFEILGWFWNADLDKINIVTRFDMDCCWDCCSKNFEGERVEEVLRSGVLNYNCMRCVSKYIKNISL